MQAEVSLSQLAQNMGIVKQQLKRGVRMLFVVKLDGYGHGITAVSRVAEEVGLDYLGVASVSEAKRIRRERVKLPILILNLPSKEHIEEIVKLHLTATIANNDIYFASFLDQESQIQDTITPIHIKVDTGLGRIGLLPREVVPFLRKLQDFPHLQVEGIYSQFSVAESEDSTSDREYTLNQIKRLRQILQELEHEAMLPPLCHIANSAGFIQYQDEVTEAPLNMVRLGTLLYGYPEVQRPWTGKIRPVMSLFTEIIDIRQLPRGSYISYGRTYKTNSVKMIAVLPVGYGNGLDRRLSNVGGVIIKGRKAPIIGTICANHTMVDISEIEGIQVGDRVELMGENLLASELGRGIGASILEILASFTGRGIKHVYTI